jgi:hypothetical protein
MDQSMRILLMIEYNPDSVLGMGARGANSLDEIYTLNPNTALLNQFKLKNHIIATNDGDEYVATTLFPVIITNNVTNEMFTYKIGSAVRILIYHGREPQAFFMGEPVPYVAGNRNNNRNRNRKSRKTRNMRKTRKSRRV